MCMLLCSSSAWCFVLSLIVTSYAMFRKTMRVELLAMQESSRKLSDVSNPAELKALFIKKCNICTMHCSMSHYEDRRYIEAKRDTLKELVAFVVGFSYVSFSLSLTNYVSHIIHPYTYTMLLSTRHLIIQSRRLVCAFNQVVNTPYHTFSCNVTLTCHLVIGEMCRAPLLDGGFLSVHI